MMNRRQGQRRAAAWVPAVVWLTVAMAVTACEDDDDIDIIEPLPIVGAVAVFADSTFDFGALQTFAMPDTIVHFNPLTGTPLAVPRTFDQAILDQVRQNFLARGYVEEANPDSIAPDFIVLVAATATENRAAWVSYPWFSIWGFYAGFGWFAPGFDNSWGIVYPWGGSVTLTSFPRGTLVVDLIPTLQVNPLNRRVTSAWAGVATALLTGSATTATVTGAVDEMFALSPYLRADTIP